MPSTLTGVPSGFRLGQLSCVDIEVGENLGDVIQLFDHIHEPYNALGVGPLHPNRVAGDHCELGRVNGEPAAAEGILNRVELKGSGGDDVLVALANEVFSAALQGSLQSTVFIVAR